jgi:hypothetical protein
MSWYATVALSFNEEEGDEKDRSNHDCGPLRKINTWLKRHGGYDPMENLNTGLLATNAVLFGRSYNHLDVEEFCKVVLKQKWKYPSDVQLLFWGEEDTRFAILIQAGVGVL